MTANLDREKARERKKELLLTFERMVTYAKEHGAEGILIAGDLFDTNNISATTRHAVENALHQNPDITFFYLQGNHDTDNFLSGMENVPDNLKLFGTQWTSYELGETGRVVVTGLEFDSQNVGEIYHTLVLNPEKCNLVMLHGQESEHGAKDKAEVIQLRRLKNRGIDYLALGHIHSYKEESLDARGVYCYPGCLEGRGFDECGDHGFVLLTIDEESGQVEREFISFASRRLHEIAVDVSDCKDTMEAADRIERELTDQQVPDRDLVKVVLTGTVDVENEIDLVYLKKKLEPHYYFVKIADDTRLRVDMEQFLHDESLKGEFVRAVMAADDIDDADRADVIRYGLQAIAGEEMSE